MNRYVDEIIEEKKTLQRLLKLSPKVTAENLVKLNSKTWILKKNPDEDNETVKLRYLEKLEHSHLHNWAY